MHAIRNPTPRLYETADQPESDKRADITRF
jgi:hypothetical protein